MRQPAQSYPPPPSKSEKKKGGCGRLIGIAFLVFVGLVVIVALTKKDTPTGSSSSYSSSSAASSQPDLRPDSQKTFEDVVAQFVSKFNDAGNELQQSAARKERGRAIGGLNLGLNVEGWVGTLSRLGTNNDGDAYITVELNRNLSVSAWNNALSDIEDKTLIKSGSALFDALASMSKGRRVKFSGSFVRSSEDFYREKSLTIQGSMTDPDFAFRFKEVTPLP